MKIIRVARVLVLCAAVLAGGSSALALTGISPAELSAMPTNIQVNSPANGSPIGRSVVLSGVAQPDTGLSVAIDGNSYVDPRDRGVTEGRGGSTPTVSDANGQFSVTLDLNGPSVTVNSQGQLAGISSGNHQFVIYEMYAQNGGKSQAVTLNVDSAAAQTVASTATPTASPSPSPTAAPGQVKGAWSWPQTLLVLAAALLGAVAGYGGYRLAHRRR